MSDDLWGDLPEVQEIVHPRTVLKEQAAVLAERTQGVLHGEVRLQRGRGIAVNGQCWLNFTIVCPSLQNYRYDVLSVDYRLGELYPARIVDLANERKVTEVQNLDEFKEAIKGILQSERVRTAIAALLRDAEESDD